MFVIRLARSIECIKWVKSCESHTHTHVPFESCEREATTTTTVTLKPTPWEREREAWSGRSSAQKHKCVVVVFCLSSLHNMMRSNQTSQTTTEGQVERRLEIRFWFTILLHSSLLWVCFVFLFFPLFVMIFYFYFFSFLCHSKTTQKKKKHMLRFFFSFIFHTFNRYNILNFFLFFFHTCSCHNIFVFSFSFLHLQLPQFFIF